MPMAMPKMSLRRGLIIGRLFGMERQTWTKARHANLPTINMCRKGKILAQRGLRDYCSTTDQYSLFPFISQESLLGPEHYKRLRQPVKGQQPALRLLPKPKNTPASSHRFKFQDLHPEISDKPHVIRLDPILKPWVALNPVVRCPTASILAGRASSLRLIYYNGIAPSVILLDTGSSLSVWVVDVRLAGHAARKRRHKRQEIG
ncbi:hypothetical protein BDR22DRAFT_966271 [Usnea florida]